MTRSIPCIVAVFALVAFTAPAHAQFNRLLNSVKNQVERKASEQVERVLEGEPAAQTHAQGDSPRLDVEATSPFVPGDRVLMHDTFADALPGTMPRSWQTNGSGQVVRVRQIPGQWLDLQAGSVYKLAKPIDLPDRFTVEFELLAVVDRIDDLYPLEFGFADDGSVGRNREINKVSLQYYNDDKFLVTSRATEHYHESDFDLRGYANRPMPVAITVDGDQMQVYLDGRKISDARLFRDNVSRHFYFVAPSRMDNGGRLAFGNFRIAAFGEDLARLD